MKLYLNSRDSVKRFNNRLWSSAADGSISVRTLRKVISCQKYSLHLFLKKNIGVVLPADSAVYRRIGAVLIVTSLALYISDVNVTLHKIKNTADDLSIQNSSLKDELSSLGNVLDETSGKLGAANDTIEEKQQALEEAQTMLDQTQEKLEETEADAKAKQDEIDSQKQIIDSIESSEESKRAGLEETIKELINTFGIQTQSRSGSALYSSLEKIEAAKSIIAINLGSNPNAAAYIKALNEEKVKIEDKLKRYPDYEPAIGQLTSRFGNRTYSNGGKLITDYHNGIDIANSEKVSIYAAAYGKVVEAVKSDGGGLGLYVKIDHGNGFITVYGHMSKVDVSLGQIVEKGQKIGVMGCSGVATGTHVHIEVFLNGARQNPLNYVYTDLK